MSKELKFLYQSSIKKQIVEEKREKDPKDPAIEIVKKVKSAKPVKVAILKPTRRLFDAADEFYAQRVNYYVTKGLMPLSLFAKRYANDGGAVSEPEKKVIEDLRTEIAKYQEEYFSLDGKDVSETTTKKRQELLLKINNVNQQLNSIQNAYADIYDNTAEMKARNKTIEWWVLQLTYADLDGQGQKPFFGEGDYDKKYEVYEDYEDESDPFILEVIGFCSYLVSFWLTARGSLSKEDLAKLEFEAMEKLYFETVSDYEVEEKEETPVAKVEEPTPESQVTETPKPVTPTV